MHHDRFTSATKVLAKRAPQNLIVLWQRPFGWKLEKGQREWGWWCAAGSNQYMWSVAWVAPALNKQPAGRQMGMQSAESLRVAQGRHST